MRAARASSHSLATLANLCGYAAHTQLCRQLNAKRVPVTALTTKRLRALANVVGYDGSLLKAARRG